MIREIIKRGRGVAKLNIAPTCEYFTREASKLLGLRAGGKVVFGLDGKKNLYVKADKDSPNGYNVHKMKGRGACASHAKLSNKKHISPGSYALERDDSGWFKVK